MTAMQAIIDNVTNADHGMASSSRYPFGNGAGSSSTAQTPKNEGGAVDAATPSQTTINGGASRQTNNGEDDAVMMLEDFAMGNRANTRRAAQKLVPRPGRDAQPGDSPDAQRVILETAINQRSSDPVSDVAYRFLLLTPPADVQREMVNYWFERLEWYTQCIHRPSYMEDLHLLLSLDTETAARTVRPTFLCVHLMVICLVIHLCSTEDVVVWGYDRQTAQTMCDTFFAGSQQLLWASDFIGSHQLEHLQAVVMIAVYAYNVDEQADAAYALVGASIKIAQNLALNRLDDARHLAKERQRSKNAAAAAQAYQSTSPLERELGRRIWWHLVWLDWSHSLSHGGCYAIHPSQIRTNLPTNINDEDLTLANAEKSQVVARPIEEYTQMSFTIWRIRFLNLYRETIDILTSPTGMTQAQLMDMDRKFMDTLGSLPTYFQIRMEEHESWTYGDSCHDMELLSIQMTGWNRLLRLHRPFLARALFERSTNNPSRKRCVEAAYNILAIVRHARMHAPTLLRIWIYIYYVFSGALVLFLDLCYDEVSESKEEKRKALREMLAICDTARHLSAASKNTYNLLYGLLEAETELRVNQRPTKRKRNSNAAKGENAEPGSTNNNTSSAPFVSLVERVLVDAASKNSSGDSASSSLGRSPNEYSTPVSAGLLDGPSKRHNTSYVRERHSSSGSNTTATRGHYNLRGAGQPSSSSAGAFAGQNVYYPDGTINTTVANQYAPTGSYGGAGPTALSPWSRSNAAAGGMWGTANTSAGPSQQHNFPSPSSATFGIGSPTGSAGMFAGQDQARASSQYSISNFRGGPVTTSGLSSLLDEDIFSGLLMNQSMENNSDWESALAFVAPLPTPTGTASSVAANNTTGGSGGARPMTTGATPGAHHQHLQQQSPNY
jgi:hypothetical protein